MWVCVYGRVPYCAANKEATDMKDLKWGDTEIRCVGLSSALNYDLFKCGSLSVVFSPPLKGHKVCFEMCRYSHRWNKKKTNWFDVR